MKFFNREDSNGPAGKDEWLKVKFPSWAPGLGSRAGIIGRLHKITASELNKRTIKHIFITHDYSKFIFPNLGWHICFYLRGIFPTLNLAWRREILRDINEDKLCIFPLYCARPRLSLCIGYNTICESRSPDSRWMGVESRGVRTVGDIWRRYSI